MPWPMRLGPPPSTMIFLRSVGAPRTPPRRWNTCRRSGGEFGRAGIDALVHRAHVQFPALGAHRMLIGAEQLGEAAVRETVALEDAHRPCDSRPASGRSRRLPASPDLLDLIQEPGVDLAVSAGPPPAHADSRKASPTYQSRSAPGLPISAMISPRRHSSRPGRRHAGFQAAQGLLQGFLEGAADGHHLAHRLHLGGQAVVGLGNFSKAKRGTLVTT
jgi:hypothetical protein